MSLEHAKSQISLVVKWPQIVPAEPAPLQLLRRLSEDRLPSTWSVETAAQARFLIESAPSAESVETAILAAPIPCAGSAAANELAPDWYGGMSRQLDEISKYGSVGTVHISSAAGALRPERRLHAMGITAVVNGEARAAAGPLPFGLFGFAPQAIAPVMRSWRQLFSGPAMPSIHPAPHATAMFDVAELSRDPRRGWRQVEGLISQATSSRATGFAEVVTVATAAADLAAQRAPRTQRSILRVA